MTPSPNSRRLALRVSPTSGWKQWLLSATLATGCFIHSDAFALSKELANSGIPQVNIIIKPGASAAVTAAANDLAAKLNEITGGTFTVTTGDGSTGIAIGKEDDFTSSAWPFGSGYFDSSSPTGKEAYAIRSHNDGVFIGVSSDSAVDHAVSDLLYRLGYRLFFPGYTQVPGTPANPRMYTWEVVPNSPTLSVDVDVTESPDYHARNIWYGYGDWSFNNPASTYWQKRNRLGSGLEINAGHSFAGIVNRNLAAFAANPDYVALVGGVRMDHTSGGVKFCLSNPALRALVVNDTLNIFAANPSRTSVSLEPSDGGNWCECASCAALGNRADQLLTLANEVAAAVDAVYPGQKYIGMYAYNEHAAPPLLTVHPQIVVLVATGFTPGLRTADLLNGWSSKGATIGIREYYGITTSDRDLPGKSRGSAPEEIRDTIADFHDNYGAIFMSAESSANFGPSGLGYYLASQYLWDTSKVDDHDALIADFLTKAYGPAATEMGAFYNTIDKKNRPLMSTDLINRMYEHCQNALALTSDPKIRRRIYDMALYTRYVEMFFTYKNASETARQTAFADLMVYLYRIRKTMVVHSYGLWRDIPARDKTVTVPPGHKFNEPTTASGPANPWKVDIEYTDAEIDALITNGLANNPRFSFTPVAFSRDLVPATPLGLTASLSGTIGYLRYAPVYAYVWNPNTTGTHTFLVSGTRNLVYGDRKMDITLATSGLDEIETDVVNMPIGIGKNVLYTASLSTTAPGLHHLEVLDYGGAFTMVPNPGNTPYTFEVSNERLTKFRARNTLYFYVPKGTTVVGGYSAAGGGQTIRDASNTIRHEFATGAEYFSVPVPSGQDGKLWRFQNISSEKILMTVPPFVARTPQELLLPREVVEADAP